MSETGEAPSGKKGTAWSKVLLIALAGILVIAMVVGVAFAVTGTKSSSNAAATEVGGCSGSGTGCQGAAGEGRGYGSREAECDGECEAGGKCDGECEAGGECDGECTGEGNGSGQGGRCYRNQAPQEQPAPQVQ